MVNKLSEGYRLGSDNTPRCSPGMKELPTLCEWHDNHYWCDACDGYYGIPHDLYGCHTMQKLEGVILPGSTRPQVNHKCACRFCTIWSDSGYDAVVEYIKGRRVQESA